MVWGMDWMLLLTLVATVTAIFSAIFGFVQANEAKKSGKLAKEAREKAEAAEGKAVAARDAAVRAQQESASAAGRIAEVLEEQAAASRAAASVRPDPWELQPGRYTAHGTALLLVRTGLGEVVDVSIEVERKPTMFHVDPSPVPTVMRPGDSVEIYYMRMGSDSSTSTLVVRWRWPDEDEMRETRGPLN